MDDTERMHGTTGTASPHRLAGTRPDPSTLLRAVAVLALATLALTWTFRLLTEHWLELPLWHEYWWRDYAGNLAFTLLAALLIRRVRATLAFAGITLAGFHAINATKLLVLGLPGSPDDFAHVVNLYHLADGPWRFAVVAIAVLPFVLLLWLVRWRSLATWCTVSLLAAAVTLIAMHPEPLGAALDRRFGNSDWNQAGNFRQRGLALHLLQESLRGAATSADMPSRAAVNEALRGLPHARADLVGLEPRNVHMIVLESFFDPVSLGPEWAPEDPFPPEFRALWEAAGHSVALSPVFGGYTANAEFEALCGFPILGGPVFFEGGLMRPAPCLPRVLADAGYRSVAAHPNVPGFWNRTVAYHRVGFETFRSLSSFDLTDAVGEFLLDHAFYDQVFEQLGPPAESPPTFNYLLTYFGHLPYPSNAAYPERVRTLGGDTWLQAYVNQLWYKSRDLMARLERLRAEDPEALIVVFGDHLPYLDVRYGVYDTALDLPEERTDFSAAQFEFLFSAPLIVIDGRHGPIDVGKVPLYRLPALILERLGASGHGAFAWAENPPGTVYRPVHGMHFETSATRGGVRLTAAMARVGEGEGLACVPDEASADCAPGTAWLARTRTLTEDLFGGRQFGLERTRPPPPLP